MELNKCSRCGAFFASNNSVCPNCEAQERLEISKLKTFLNENNPINISTEQIACSTGISQKNVARFLAQDEFTNL